MLHAVKVHEVLHLHQQEIQVEHEGRVIQEVLQEEVVLQQQEALQEEVVVLLEEQGEQEVVVEEVEVVVEEVEVEEEMTLRGRADLSSSPVQIRLSLASLMKLCALLPRLHLQSWTWAS